MSVFGGVLNALMRNAQDASSAALPAPLPAYRSARPVLSRQRAGLPGRRRALCLRSARLWSGQDSRRIPMERAELTDRRRLEGSFKEVGRAARAGALIAAHPMLRPDVDDTSNGRSAVPEQTGPSSAAEQAIRSPLSPAAAFYVDGLGWPIAIQAHGIMLRCGEVVDVLAMPIGLGAEVNHVLSVNLIPVPIMEVRGQGRSRWAFFCEAGSLSTKATTLGVLSLHQVVHFGAGNDLPLPSSPSANGAALRWVVEPRLDIPLPHWASLVSCLLTVIKR